MDPAEVFELDQLIGHGAFGTVWSAQQKSTGDMVAIKVIPVDDDIRALEGEIEILKQCEHDLVVEYLGTYEKESTIWIVMELCEAGSVSDLLNYCNITLEEHEIKAIIASVALGLEYLHAKKLIHRDIKAGNILLSSSGQAKLADFGVAARLTTMVSQRTTMTGAPYWMAPEVLQEEKYNQSADIWSLGITILEIANGGKPPHHHIHPMRVVFVIPNKPSPTFPNPDEFSTEANSFLSGCLIKKKKARMTASDILCHPWLHDDPVSLEQLENSGQSEILGNLVDRCLPEIERGRQEQRTCLSEGDTLPSSLHSTLRNTLTSA